MNLNQCLEYFTISVSFMIYESMYFITESESESCLLFISFTNLNLVLVYYLLFYYLHCTMMNLHGLNCYCWDFIINIYIFFYNFRDGDPYARDPDIAHEFPQNLGVLPHIPLCVSPLLRTPVPETWWNIGNI
jgi:hypothetical protein